MNKTFQVTFADGTKQTRKSKTNVYTHAAVAKSKAGHWVASFHISEAKAQADVAKSYGSVNFTDHHVLPVVEV